MKIKLLVSALILFGIAFSSNAQNFKMGSVAYYESLRIAYQSKIDWVQDNPEEHIIAIENNWYEMANANVEKMEANKILAEQSLTQIYIPPSSNESKSINNGGGGTCAEAALFCTDYEYSWPCGTDEEPGETGPDYGCLGSQPNPAWYYMHVENSGDIIMELSAPQDIDFIIWGPFESVTCDYADLSDGNIVDCSFSATNLETPEIGPNSTGGPTTATSGEYYVFMITNYSNQAQDFTLLQTSGDGTSTCDLQDIISLSINVGDCEPAQSDSSLYSMYDIDVLVSYPDSLVLDSVVFMLDNTIFQTLTTNLDSPLTFNMENQIADEIEHSIFALLYFENDTIVSPTQFYTLVNCAVCEVNAGEDIMGNSLQAGASVEVSDYNYYWEALCEDFVFFDSTQQDTEVNYVGTSNDSIYCDLVWTITNYMNLTCKDTISVLYIPLPSEPVFEDTTGIACFEDSVFLSVVNTPSYTYHWELPDSWAGQSDSNSIVFYPTGVSGTISVTAESIYGMGTTNTIEYIVMDYPIADFTYSFTNTELSLTNLSQFASSYLWDFGDSTYSNESDPVHVYTDNGAYLVKVVAENYCGLDSNFTNILVSGIGIEERKYETLKVYPNPTTGIVNISGVEGTQIFMEVIDITGRVLLTESFFNEESVHLDLTVLKNGVYQIRLNNALNKTIVLKK